MSSAVWGSQRYNRFGEICLKGVLEAAAAGGAAASGVRSLSS